jgi:hypothetical protein
MQATFEQNLIADRILDRSREPFGKRIGIVGKIFGCWHKELSRPFTDKKQSYRACLECGARKQFNTNSFTTSGPFYYPPIVKAETEI